MKNAFFHTCLGTILLLGSASLLALPAEPITDDDAAEINQSVIPEDSAFDQVEEAIDAYFERKKISEGAIGKGGKIYYRAIETVQAEPANPAWIKSRQMAFEKALLKAQARFIFDNFGHAVVNIENKLSEDNSSNNRNFPEQAISRSRIASLWDKAVALGDAKLNQLLEEAGVEPSEYSAIPAEQRKDLFIDSFIKTSVRKAMGESSGLLPVQTFEGSDGSGNHAVGVVMLRSDKLQQLASDMAHQNEPFLKSKKGKPISAYVDFPEDKLAYQFGVRVVFNEEGRPLVLSYGQWGFGYAGKSASRLARERNHAAEQADAVAAEALTVFMNSRITFEAESEKGESTKQFLIKQGDEIREEEIYTFVDKLSKEVKQKSSAKLAGTRIVKRWKYKHPYGHEIVGRVRLWSMNGVETAKNVASFKADRQSRSAEVKSGVVNTPAGVNAGISFDDEEEDF